jgi:ribosomal protein S18 acetylase RimI-like enzyme
MRTDDWLSDRLGRRAFWVDPEDGGQELTGHAREHAPAFYQARVPADAVDRLRELGAAGMNVIDATVTLRTTPAGRPTTARPVRVAPAREDDRDGVLRVAADDYRVSRFHLDPAIPGDVASRIKHDWLAAFFDGTRGERLLVAELDGAVAGFLGVTSHDGGATRVIDAIAVKAAARERGVGHALVEALLADPGPGCEAIDVGTQAANPRAISFYERLGFLTQDVRFVLHAHPERA